MSKLYATATSEKASKGQGGNEFLETMFTVEKAAPRYKGDTLPVLSVSMRYDKASGHISIRVRSQIDERPDMVLSIARDTSGRTIEISKGEKQKGEWTMCKHIRKDCPICHK